MSKMNRRTMFGVGAGAAAMMASGTAAADPDHGDGGSLPGFRHAFARVNGTRLHYVTGGRGAPLILLPGWPQTWWSYHKVLPALAARYRVIAVDLRGMGESDKPTTGFDKKTMARDIVELARHLGYNQVNIAGHDIGAMVAYSFAVNHPAATRRVALMDVPHPNEFLHQVPLLPKPGEFSPWWFAFNQVAGLPEQLVSGDRAHFLVDWMLDNLGFNPEAFSRRDRAIYARAYSRPEAIRAGNGWYQAFNQDIEDQKGYGLVTAPLLGLSTEPTHELLLSVWPHQGTDVRVTKVPGSGHFMLEEAPEAVTRLLIDFFG